MVVLLYAKSHCSQVNTVWVAIGMDEKIYGDLFKESYLDKYSLFAGSNLCKPKCLYTQERWTDCHKTFQNWSLPQLTNVIHWDPNTSEDSHCHPWRIQKNKTN